MTEREEVIRYCLSFENTYEDYPFPDTNWCLIRHNENKKAFAWIYERNGRIWVNLKVHPDWREFWRSAFESVIPGYHQNKEHWNSVILDGTVPDKDIFTMIRESYELTGSAKKKSKGNVHKKDT